MRILAATNGGYLSDEQKGQLAVLFEAILPGDEMTPGATDAGAVDFVDATLAADEGSYYEIAAWRRLYCEGLPALDAISRDRFGLELGALDNTRATELLHSLVAGELIFPGALDPKRLFSTMRDHCIEGCFSDPRWRGNHEAILWRWIGYPTKPGNFKRGTDGVLRQVDR